MVTCGHTQSHTIIVIHSIATYSHTQSWLHTVTNSYIHAQSHTGTENSTGAHTVTVTYSHLQSHTIMVTHRHT